jgi:hypothetical protein
MKKLHNLWILVLLVTLSCQRNIKPSSNGIAYLSTDSILKIKFWNISIVDSVFVLKTVFNSFPDSFITKKIFKGANILGLEYYFDLDINKKEPGGNFNITYDYLLNSYHDSLLIGYKNHFRDSSIIYFYQLALDESKYIVDGPYGNGYSVKEFRHINNSNIFNERLIIGDTLVIKMKFSELKSHFNPFLSNSKISISLRTNLKDNFSRFGNDKSIRIINMNK